MMSKVQRYFQSLLFAFRIMFHPFDGFWDMKHEKKGTLSAAITIIILTIIALVCNHQFAGFIFNTNKASELDIIMQIVTVLGPVLVWCIANWCLTTLFDGEGSFKDIFMATGYSLAPLVIFIFPAVLLSNVLTIEEQAFYDLMFTIPLIWLAILLFSSTLTVHQYTPLKTVFIILFIILGMMIILFLALLFFTLLQSLSGFIVELFEELMQR